MNRRTFIRYGTQAAAVVPIWAPPPPSRASRASLLPRSRFPRRAAADRHHHGVLPRTLRTDARKGRRRRSPAGQELTLLTAPKFIAETLGLHNVEIWSAQFADQSIDYCRQVKAAAEA